MGRSYDASQYGERSKSCKLVIIQCNDQFLFIILLVRLSYKLRKFRCVTRYMILTYKIETPTCQNFTFIHSFVTENCRFRLAFMLFYILQTEITLRKFAHFSKFCYRSQFQDANFATNLAHACCVGIVAVSKVKSRKWVSL